jgi:phospholipid-binding lipoprotein MlaA
MGMKPTDEDFGQTLAVWGVNGGPYLVLPLLGPSTLRDGIGMGVSQFLDPYRFCLSQCDFVSTPVQYGMTAGEVIDTRSQLIDSGADALLKSSADPYATARSAYLQRRRAAILDQDGEASAGSGGAGDDAGVNAALKDLDSQSGTAPATDQTTPQAPAPDQPATTPPAQ